MTIYDVIVICLFVLMTGACIGSFLNVVALRAISGESIVFPASKCPLCNQPIKWYDNIPVLSYLFTFKGKCRNCGGKVSIQYPIVESITAILFLAIFLTFGISLQTLLFLILACISIVICITDFKKEYVFDVHSWILIITSVLAYLSVHGFNWQSLMETLVGLVVGVVVMELIARLSYFLIRKNDSENSDETENNENDVQESQEEDINEYIKEKKRAFGEGDTYLVAAAGALLGWKLVLVSVVFAILLQAVCILPQFIISLLKQKETKLLFSLSSFILLSILYSIFSKKVDFNTFTTVASIGLLIYLAMDIITKLKKNVNNQGFMSIPFGPAILVSMFIVFFFGNILIEFISKNLFMFS